VFPRLFVCLSVWLAVWLAGGVCIVPAIALHPSTEDSTLLFCFLLPTARTRRGSARSLCTFSPGGAETNTKTQSRSVDVASAGGGGEGGGGRHTGPYVPRAALAVLAARRLRSRSPRLRAGWSVDGRAAGRRVDTESQRDGDATVAAAKLGLRRA